MAIEGRDGVDQPALGVPGNSRGIANVMNGIARLVELNPLQAAWEEACAPLAGGDGLRITSAYAGHDDEARQVFRFAAQALVHPGPHRRPAIDGGAGIDKGMGGIVIDLLGYQ